MKTKIYSYKQMLSASLIKDRLGISKAQFYAALFFCFAVLSVFNFGCGKTYDLAVIRTEPVTNITASSANCGGYIINNNNSDVTERGVCWSTYPNPTIKSSKTIDGKGKGKYISFMTDLVIGKTYYVRAYATNEAGTSYGKEISFIPYGEISDIDGNIYTTVIIGTQVWMTENLKTTKYNDGIDIKEVGNIAEWNNPNQSLGEAFCNYNDSSANGITYGRLYSGYAAQSTKICPVGWHIPTTDEWNTLIDYLGGANVAGGKLKESGTSHWSAGNTGTNSSGFSALPGGYRSMYYDEEMGNSAYYWSSTRKGYEGCYFKKMVSGDNTVGGDGWSSNYGMSLRCVHD